MTGPGLQTNRHWKALAVLAVVNGLAGTPVAMEVLKQVNAAGPAMLYAGIFGLLLVISGLVLPPAVLAGWFASAVLLWRCKRTGVRVLRLLSGLQSGFCSITLGRMLANWDSYERALAAYAAYPLPAMMRYRGTMMFLALVVGLSLVAMSYSFWGLRLPPTQKSAIS